MRLPNRPCVLLMACLGSTGCAGAHLYHEGNFTVAQKAQATFEAADLPGSIDTERAHLEQMLQTELAIARRHWRAQRDKPLGIMIDAAREPLDKDTDKPRDQSFFWPVFLCTTVNKRLDDLGSGDLEALQNLEIEIGEKEKGLAGFKDQYLLVQPTKEDPAPTCPLPEEIPTEVSSAAAQTLFGAYSQACAELLELFETRKTRLASFSGSLRELAMEIAEDDEERVRTRAELQRFSLAYKMAKKAYDDAVKDGQATDLAAEAEDLKKKLGAWMEVAAEIGKLKPLHLDSLIGALEEAQGHVSDVLDAVITVGEEGSQALGPEIDAKLRLVAVLPSLASELGDALKLPNVSGLLLESEHLRLQRELAKRRLANANLRLELRGRKYKAMITELGLLRESEGALLRFRKDADGKQLCPAKGPLVEAFGDSTSECKAWIAEALLAFANSWDAGRAVQEEIDYHLIGLQHDVSLDSSEIALAQWQNLIGIPVSQLVALHGTGIKPDDIGNLVQALGLGAIASNVD